MTIQFHRQIRMVYFSFLVPKYFDNKEIVVVDVKNILRPHKKVDAIFFYKKRKKIWDEKYEIKYRCGWKVKNSNKYLNVVYDVYTLNKDVSTRVNFV